MLYLAEVKKQTTSLYSQIQTLEQDKALLQQDIEKAEELRAKVADLDHKNQELSDLAAQIPNLQGQIQTLEQNLAHQTEQYEIRKPGD